MPDLLLELFSEEIPARMQRRAAEDLKRLVTDALVARGFLYEGAKAFATPRRLALHVAGLPARGQDVREERRGPRVGAPETAVQGFLKSAGLTSLDQAKVERDPKKGEFYVAVIERSGRPTPEVLGEILPGLVRDFPWPKSMRWGPASREPGALRWVRPLHSIVCTFGPETEPTEVVPFGVDGIAAGAVTRGHRFLAPEPFAVRRFDDYVAGLERARVVLDADRRKDIIRADAESLAFARGLEVVEDEALLEEVAGLVEWPVALMGSFEEQFLSIPPEVIRATIRANQKSFVLRRPHPSPLAGEAESRSDRKGGVGATFGNVGADTPAPVAPSATRPSPQGGGESVLANQFVLVSNLDARDGGAAIVAGNERVVRARLADAKFFWDTDRKTRLEDRLDKLKSIVFHEKLGTQHERVERIAALARELAPVVGADPDLAERAARLAKTDLVTEMVGEFPELQGLMGRYYAAAQDEHPSVAAAIEEHYKPLGPGDRVPTDPVSVAVALADKIDTLVGFWAIDEKPTGSKDPYALRRAALGVIRLVLESRVRLPLTKFLQLAYLILIMQTWQLNRLVAIQGQTFHEFSLIRVAPLLRNFDQFGRFFGTEDEYFSLRSQSGSTGWIYDKNMWHLPWRSMVGDLLSFLADRLKVYLREQGARHDLIDAVFSLGAGQGAPASPIVGEAESASADRGGGAGANADRGSTDTPAPVALRATRPSPQGGGQGAPQDDLLMIVRRVEALGRFLDTEDGQNLLTGYRRAANILRIEEKKDGRAYDAPPDLELIAARGQIEEKALAVALEKARREASEAVAAEDFGAAMLALSRLRSPVDAFFDRVTVNADDPALRDNRLKLLNEIRRATLAVADFSKIGG